MKLAPIGISTYTRINHLELTIKALQKNTLAKYSDLYIFSDGPQKGDEGKVAQVREYIHALNGFKKVFIVERKKNSRTANNRGGMKLLLDKYGRMIWMEEDIVTAPGFLAFMNDAIEFYKNDKRIISISGYCPPIKIPNKYKKEMFVLQRFNAWGFATWKEKFNPFGFDIHKHDVEKFLTDKDAIKNFKKNGEDMYLMLLSEHEGKLDALDVKIMYYEYKYNMRTLYPSKSLVQNIGFDGSGIHCGVSDAFHHDRLWNKTEKFDFINNIQVNEKIRKANHKFRDIGLKLKIILFTQKIGVFPFLKTVKKMVMKK